MENFKVICFVIFVNLGVYCFACENDDTDFQSITEMCNQTHQTSAEKLLYLYDQGILQDENEMDPKCFLRCLFETSFMVSLEDGSYDNCKAVRYFGGMKTDDNSKQDELLKIAEKCGPKTDHADMCERTYRFVKCFITKGNEYLRGEVTVS
uniref:Odorant binding protein 9 n=1 Tax=Chrysopa pallens TaxID=417485 RepID=A0A0R8PAQ0_CHRPA|nr:odorant binding protein 9 [Chrysopa pallens]